MHIHVRYTQNKGFVRYLLQRADGCFWSGQAWKRNRRRAALYLTLGDAHRAYFRLTDTSKEDRGPCRLFTARFEVFVNGSAQYTPDELKEWLLSHVCFTLSTEDGPVDGCRTQVFARFSTLSEKFYKKRGER